MKTKKVFAAILALALAMGFGTTAFAKENTHTTPGTETIGVEGSYVGTFQPPRGCRVLLYKG